MKTIPIIFLVFLVSLKSQSQNANELVFNEQLNNLTTERLGYAPTVFLVKNKKYTETTKTSSKRITQAYKDALQVIRVAEKDSIKAALNEKSQLSKKREITKLRGYIDKFLKSKDNYDSKKGMLKNAQKISNKYSLGYLLYADAELNTHFKSKFFVLSRNKMDLKIHLKKILWKMDANKKSESVAPVNTQENKRLKDAREHLKSVKKHELIQGKPNVRSYNVLTLGEDLKNPDKEIYGHFEALGEYYVLAGGNGYKTDQVVPAKEVKKKNIKEDNFVFEIAVILIQHSITKSTYLVSPGYLDQYAINRVASQGKFRGKTSFPEKIYRNEKDKIYDSLIFDYNKSQIASMTDFN